MFTHICFVLSAIALCIFSVHAKEECGPTNTRDLNFIFMTCAKEHDVTDAQIKTATELEDVTFVKACFWACCLRKTGFLDKKGRYVLYPGLTYIRYIVKRDDVYTDLETIAKQCESVNDMALKYEETGCERSSLVAACFMEQMDQIRFFI
ncbi:hypothetical protein PYW08_011726 [Mythimna loreyi]|uniref:Uncharacterized protein n=1 Tax=Mythimna loreyi TaxID=667449 RepID=A0ACC2QKA9_9NEOP|nr:hypothetical protein PYW08_011726 [Mythimna loreyi]